MVKRVLQEKDKEVIINVFKYRALIKVEIKHDYYDPLRGERCFIYSFDEVPKRYLKICEEMKRELENKLKGEMLHD